MSSRLFQGILGRRGKRDDQSSASSFTSSRARESDSEPEQGRPRKRGPIDRLGKGFHSPSVDGSKISWSRSVRSGSRNRRKDEDYHHRNRHQQGTHDDPALVNTDPPGDRPPPKGALEALCRECHDVTRIIYLDPKSRQPYRKTFFKPEPCFCCGNPWPRGLAYSEEMVEMIRSRIEGQPGYDELQVFHDECRAADRGLSQGEDEDDLEERNRRGRKKALLIGIDYKGQKGELRGCFKDLVNMKEFLEGHGYDKRDIVVLYEDWSKYRHPTKEEILRQMEKLVKESIPGDMLFLHYSGHGTQVKNYLGDEVDGKDECIVPVDHRLFRTKRDGLLIDDALHKILTQIPRGVQLTVIFDSCHSGSALDLDYEYRNGKMKHVEQLRHKYELKNEEGRVILWSGCQDGKTSADTKSGGAMSQAFIEANRRLERDDRGRRVQYTYETLYGLVNERLGERYRQKPVLSSNDKRFHMGKTVRY